MESRDGAVMRVLVSHQFGLGSILAWLSLLLVVALLQWFSWGSFSLLSLQEPTSPNSKYSTALMRGTRLVWHIIIDLSKCCSLLFCLLEKLGVRVYIGIMVVVFHFCIALLSQLCATV